MLLDTSGLLCYLHRDESLHQEAVKLIHNSNARFLVHNYILAELVALALVRRFPRAAVLTFMVDLQDNPDVSMVWVDERLHRKAAQLLTERQDKTY